MHSQERHIEQALKLRALIREIAGDVYIEREGQLRPTEKSSHSRPSLSSPGQIDERAISEIEFLLRNDQGQIHAEKLRAFINFFIDHKGFSENYDQLQILFTSSNLNGEKKKWRQDDYLIVYVMDKFWKKVIYYDKGLYQMLIDKFKDQNGNEFEYNRLKSLLNKYKTKVARYRPSIKTDKIPKIIYWDELAEKLLSFLLSKT